MRLSVLFVAIAFLVVPMAAGAADIETSPVPSPDAVQPVGMNLLAGFIPPVTVISSGQSVAWVNNDLLTAVHTVNGILGAPPGSGNIAPGGTYSATFGAGPAVVPYHCTLHPWMNGVIIVLP